MVFPIYVIFQKLLVFFFLEAAFLGGLPFPPPLDEERTPFIDKEPPFDVDIGPQCYLLLTLVVASLYRLGAPPLGGFPPAPVKASIVCDMKNVFPSGAVQTPFPVSNGSTFPAPLVVYPGTRRPAFATSPVNKKGPRTGCREETFFF